MTAPSHVMIGHGLVDLDHVTLKQLEGCRFKWEFSSNLINRTNYHEHSLKVFAYLCCRSMARAVTPLNFNAFLEKAKFKDDGSNYADWVRNLKIILTATQKAYVLDALLGAPPPQASSVDVVNVWQTRSNDYLIV